MMDITQLPIASVGRLSGTKQPAAVPSPDQQSPGDFASLIGNAVSGLSQKLQAAETVSVGALQGNVPVQQVAEQLMSAEQSLQLSIGVRDKVVAAYLEISRMSI